MRLILSSHNLYSVEYESIGRSDENLVALQLEYHPDDPTLASPPYRNLSLAESTIIYLPSPPDILYLPDRRIDTFGSCNGLVCIAPDANSLYLFNPSTRESKKIPSSPSGYGSKSRGVHCFGFGFVNDDYKIVKVGYGVFVYSLRADSWRFVSRFPYYDEMYETGVLLNGNIHWMASHVDEDVDYAECVIAAFSLEEEVFFDLPVPDIVEINFEFAVGVLNGCLCVLHTRNHMHNDFWVMTEYGVEESWTKFTLSFSYRWMRPLCVAQNGEALLQVDGKLMLYNFKDGSHRYLGVNGMVEGERFEVYTYLETLISPNAVGLEL